MTAIGQLRNTQVPINASAYAELFPMVFKRALAMDLNRPFGNGIDDNGDGSIDEPNEMLTGNLFSGSAIDFSTLGLQKSLYIAGNDVHRMGVSEFPTLDPTSGSPANFGYTYGNIDPDYEYNVNLALNNPGFVGSAAERTAAPLIANRYHGQQSRQLMARHLYCLAMLLLPDMLCLSSLPAVTPLSDRKSAV